MIPALLLIVAAVAYRIVTGLAIISGSTALSNFAPLAAIALCAAAYFPTKFKFTVPLIALLISEMAHSANEQASADEELLLRSLQACSVPLKGRPIGLLPVPSHER